MSNTNTQAAETEKNKAASQSFTAAIFLTAIKLGAGIYTNSLGLYSEALHSGIDLLAAVLTLLALRIAAMPADANHHYGHGKAENLSALAQTALLLITCGWIIGEAIERLATGGAEVSFSFAGVAVVLISIAVDVSRSRMLRRIAIKYNSQALEADALHFTTDIWSSCVVLVGLIALWAASLFPQGSFMAALLHKADACAALIVSIIVLKTGYDLSRKAIDELMDAGRTDDEQKIKEALKQITGISSVKRLRLRGSGAMLFVDLCIGIDSALSVEDGRKLARHAEEAISALFTEVDISVQIEPEGTAYEQGVISAIRDIAIKYGLSVHSLQLAGNRDLHIEVHVETAGDMTLANAHDLVSKFEKDVAQKCGSEVTIVTHLEPKVDRDSIIDKIDAGPEETSRVRQAIETELVEIGNISDCHKLTACRFGREGQGLSLSFHCRLPADISVAEAHCCVTELEHRLRRADPSLARIVIHMEPEGAGAILKS